MKVNLQINTQGYESTLQGYEQNQLPFATSLAINRTLQKARNAIRGTLQISFDRPTPYTQNALQIIPSTKTKLYGEVKLKDSAGLSSPSSYLEPQVYGGARQAKRSEYLLQRKGFLPGGMLTVPGSGARLDAYGNMSRGQIVQIISALQANYASGYTANKSYRISARKNKNTDGIFVGKPAGGRLPLGVYQRTASGELKPLLIFVSSANYKVRLPFSDIVGQVYVTNFQDELATALRDALVLTPFLQAA